MSGRAWITLKAQSCAPPTPAFFSTCWKCVLTALKTDRNRRRTRTAGSTCVTGAGALAGLGRDVLLFGFAGMQKS
jgi:hypothetical protein